MAIKHRPNQPNRSYASQPNRWHTLKNGNLFNLILGHNWTNCWTNYLDSSIVPSIQKREEKIFCHSSFNSDCIADSIDMGTSKDGGLDGLWTWYYDNGQKESEVTYKDGEEIGSTRWEYYSNGQKKSETTYKDGKFFKETIYNW